MKRPVWVMVMVLLVGGMACSSPPIEKRDDQSIRRNSDRAFEDLREEESRRNQESEERY